VVGKRYFSIGSGPADDVRSGHEFESGPLSIEPFGVSRWRDTWARLWVFNGASASPSAWRDGSAVKGGPAIFAGPFIVDPCRCLHAVLFCFTGA